MKRRIARILLVFAIAAPCSGCVWLQNEFFVFDAPPPAPAVEPAAGTDVPW